MSKSFGRGAVAGVVGTVAMTAFMLMGPAMGMPKMNVGRMLGMFMGVPEAAGWVAHFMIGSVLGIGYVAVFQARLRGSGAVRGIIYSLVPWIMAQVIVNPVMGAGVFAIDTPAPVSMVMGSLLGHIVYGAVLGAVYGTRTSPLPGTATAGR